MVTNHDKIPVILYKVTTHAKTQNEALLLKFLHKQSGYPLGSSNLGKNYQNGKLPGQTKKGSSGGVMWWIAGQFKGLASVSLKDGATCLMWMDLWNWLVNCHSFPELFSFATRATITMKDTISCSSLDQILHLPLWSYIWVPLFFSASKAYK